MGLNNRITIRNKPAILHGRKDYAHEIFAQGTDGFLWYKVSDPARAPTDTEVWEYQGDDIPLHGSCSPVCTQLMIGDDSVGRCCFVVTSHSQLYAKATDLQGNWGKLQPLPGIPDDSVLLTGALAVHSHTRENRIDLVAQGADLKLYWTKMTMPKTYTGSLTSNWTPLTPLGSPSVRSTLLLIDDGVVSESGPSGAPGPYSERLSLIAIDVEGFLCTSTLRFLTSEPYTITWSDWRRRPQTQSDPIVGDKISALCLARGSWPSTMIEVLAICEPNQRVCQFELRDGAWSDTVSAKLSIEGCDGCLGPPTGLIHAAPNSLECVEFFVVVQDTLLHARRTFVPKTRSVQWSGWDTVARGAFRAGPPTVTWTFENGAWSELAVYVVECGFAMLARLGSHGFMTTFGALERV